METPPRISHVLETSLYVGDLQRSRDFYARAFSTPEPDGRATDSAAIDPSSGEV